MVYTNLYQIRTEAGTFFTQSPLLIASIIVAENKIPPITIVAKGMVKLKSGKIPIIQNQFYGNSKENISDSS